MVTPLSSSTEVQHEQVIDTSADRFQTYPHSGEHRIVDIAYAVFTQIQSFSAQIYGGACDLWQKTATKIQYIFHSFIEMISGSTNAAADPIKIQVDQEDKKSIEEVDQKIQNLVKEKEHELQNLNQEIQQVQTEIKTLSTTVETTPPEAIQKKRTYKRKPKPVVEQKVTMTVLRSRERAKRIGK